MFPEDGQESAGLGLLAGRAAARAVGLHGPESFRELPREFTYRRHVEWNGSVTHRHANYRSLLTPTHNLAAGSAAHLHHRPEREPPRAGCGPRPAYHALRKQVPHQDLGEIYLDRLDERRVASNLVRRVERLGYSVAVSKAA